MGETFSARLQKIRWPVARRLEAFLVGQSPLPTIISEDCWGGEFCRTLGQPYNTPLAGVYIPSSEYLSFLENLGKSDAFELTQVASAETYPVGRTPYCTFHFLHYKTWEEAFDKFRRRAQRLKHDRLCYKIDLGKPGYTQGDIDRWQRLALAPAIVLLPPHTPPGLDFSSLTQTVLVPDWNIDGSAMFAIARRHFDFYHWLRTGRIRRSLGISWLHFLLFDPYSLVELKNRVLGASRPQVAQA